MSKDDNPKPSPTVADWFKDPADPNDPNDLRNEIRPEHKTDLIVRFHGVAPHGGHEQWLELLRIAKKQTPQKFYNPPTSPEHEAEKLKKMSAAKKHEYAIKLRSKK